MPLIIGVTMGHPSGIGPEILIKAAVRFYNRSRDISLLIFGSSRVLDFYCTILEEGVRFRELIKSQRIGIADIGNLKDDDFHPGSPSEYGNIIQTEFVKEAVMGINSHKLSAIVTMPISKIGMLREGIKIPGHTDLFKRLFNVSFVQMLFYTKGKPLIALATTHIPISRVPSAINKEEIIKHIKMLNYGMLNLFRIKNPNIAVCGLNPHAGEGGLLGSEEEEIIRPAILKAREEGISVDGPFAADSIFYRASRGRYGAVLAMYHDQGLIPVKLSGISKSVNITLGLPIIRTSPAHGTAFEMAGKNMADYRGALLSLEVASRLARRGGSNIVWNF